MASMQSSPIPFIYRALILWLDPPIAILAGIMCHFAPQVTWQLYTPPTVAGLAWKPDTVHTMLVHRYGGGLIYVALTQAVLLSYKHDDVAFWRLLNGCLLPWTFSYIYSHIYALIGLGRNPADWSAEEWVNLLISGTFFAARAGVVLGIGLGGRKGPAGGDKVARKTK